MRKLLPTLCALVLGACTGNKIEVKNKPSMMFDIPYSSHRSLVYDIYEKRKDDTRIGILITSRSYFGFPSGIESWTSCYLAPIAEIRISIDGNETQLPNNNEPQLSNSECTTEEMMKRNYYGVFDTASTELSAGKHVISVTATDAYDMTETYETNFVSLRDRIIPEVDSMYKDKRNPEYQQIVSDTTTPSLQLRFTSQTTATAEITDPESYVCTVNVKTNEITQTYEPEHPTTSFTVEIPDTSIPTTITAINCNGGGEFLSHLIQTKEK